LRITKRRVNLSLNPKRFSQLAKGDSFSVL
jgi:hypothetical protein